MEKRKTRHTHVQRGCGYFTNLNQRMFFSSKISTDFRYTSWQTLFWIWILFNHGRDNISISHHKVWAIAFWSLKFTGHLSILLDIFSTVFRQEDGAIWTRTQNLFPSFTVRRVSMEPGKKTNLNNPPFSSLNWSNTRSNPWSKSVKWLFISSRSIIWPSSSQKETVGVNFKTKESNTKRVVCSILTVAEVKSFWPFQTCHIAFSARCYRRQQDRRGTRQKTRAEAVYKADFTLGRSNISENAAFLRRLGLTSTLICQEGGASKYARQTGGIWKRWLCVSVWTENILKTQFFENDGVAIIMWFPWPVNVAF